MKKIWKMQASVIYIPLHKKNLVTRILLCNSTDIWRKKNCIFLSPSLILLYFSQLCLVNSATYNPTCFLPSETSIAGFSAALFYPLDSTTTSLSTAILLFLFVFTYIFCSTVLVIRFFILSLSNFVSPSSLFSKLFLGPLKTL